MFFNIVINFKNKVDIFNIKIYLYLNFTQVVINF